MLQQFDRADNGNETKVRQARIIACQFLRSTLHIFTSSVV